MPTLNRFLPGVLSSLGTDKKYVVRDPQGRFMHVDVRGRSLPQDTKTRAKTSAVKKRSLRVGQRVQILRQDIAMLSHRKVRTGRIVRIDGALVMVKPSWCGWEIELFREEIKPC